METTTLNNIIGLPPVHISTGMEFLDRVLGGGIVTGSTMLVAGTTGAGKSTLLLQAASAIAKQKKVLYVSGEETKEQIKLRADRLAIASDALLLAEDVDVEAIIKTVDKLHSDLVIVDSLQMLHTETLKAPPGTPSQMRYGLLKLCVFAKAVGTTFVFIGHSTKAGLIAGLQTFQHVVDCVLFLRLQADGTRLLLSPKNRFGATDVFSVLFMNQYGLSDFPNETVPFGRIQTVVLPENRIRELVKNPFLRLGAECMIFWLKWQAKKTQTLDSDGVMRVHERAVLGSHPLIDPLVSYGLRWLARRASLP